MSAEDRLLAVLEKLQQTVADLKTEVKVLAAKQEDALRKFGRGTERMDEHSERLRRLEAVQTLHKGVFVILGTGVTLCIAGLIEALLNRLG